MSSRAVIYVRQSLDRSGEGAAIDRQTEDCRRLADQRGWDVAEVITDNDMSASSGKPRPGYQRLLDLLRTRSTDVVVVWHVDRLTRRLVDLEEVIALCETTGVRLATVTGDLDLSTDTGRMLARILASVARGEVERKGARQRRANEQRAGAGKMGWTRRPFGYDQQEGAIVVVPREAEGLRKAAQMVLDGSTLAAAVRALDADDLPTTVGKPWNVKSLRYVLLNPRYAGRVSYRGVDMGEGAWPAILSAETQDRLLERLSDVRRRVQQGTEAKYLLSGLARCGRCESVLFATPMGAKGQRWMAYRCRSCYLGRRVDLVDEVVERVVIGRLSLPDAAGLLAAGDDLDELRREADALRTRRDDLAALLADGLLSASAVRERSMALTAQLRELDGRIAVAVGESPVAQLATAADVHESWLALSIRSRKAVVDLLMTVTILPAGKGQRFQPEQVAIGWRAP